MESEGTLAKAPVLASRAVDCEGYARRALLGPYTFLVVSFVESVPREAKCQIGQLLQPAALPPLHLGHSSGHPSWPCSQLPLVSALGCLGCSASQLAPHHPHMWWAGHPVTGVFLFQPLPLGTPDACYSNAVVGGPPRCGQAPESALVVGH